jgi:flagellar motor switch protein FliN/FliY
MSSSPTLLSSADSTAHPLGSMFDLNVSVQVAVGTASITVRDCLKLRRHSVVRLRESAGSDLSLSLNGVLVASGEVVIVDDSTAIRIADIAQPSSSEPTL